jgi:hypothetical protein
MSDTSNGHPKELLSAYLDDVLNIEERAAVDRHLADCEDCRAQLASLNRLARAMADEEVPPVPADLVAKVGRRLDAATVSRPRRFRYVVPATIAATIATIGILVTLQMREGHFVAPPPPEPMEQRRVRDEARPENAPAQSAPTLVVPDQEQPPSAKEDREKAVDALEKDKKQNAEGVAAPTDQPERKRNAEESAGVSGGEPGGVPAGVIGGVVGGVEGGVPAPPAASGERKAAADDGRLDQRSLKSAPAAPAPPAASRVAAKAEALAAQARRRCDSVVSASASRSRRVTRGFNRARRPSRHGRATSCRSPTNCSSPRPTRGSPASIATSRSGQADGPTLCRRRPAVPQ